MYRSNLYQNRRCFIQYSQSSYFINALYDAVLDGDLGTVTFLLTAKKVDPNCVLEDYDAAPLHTATGIGTENLAVKLVEVLLENQANPDINTSDGTTPLMISCMWGRLHVANLLLKYGADPWLEDSDGKTAINYALENGYYRIYNALQNSKNNINISSDDTVADYYGIKKDFYTFSEPCFETGKNKTLSEDPGNYSDINSESNCVEVYSLNTGFIGITYLRDSVSSTGTFMSIPLKDETVQLLENNCNRIGFHGDRISEAFNDGFLQFDGNNKTDTSQLNKISQASSHNSSSFSESSCHTSVISYGTDRIREELKKNNINHGPITRTTKKVYQNLLKRVIKGNKKNPLQIDEFSVYPEVLRSTFKQSYIDSVKKWSNLELLMSKNFLNDKRVWRGGKEKQFFTYLLLDPFITKDLPTRRQFMSDVDVWKTFIRSIFYIGKGKNSRPFSHLFEALKCNIKRTVSKKVLRIQKIWNNSAGIICLHLFHNIISAEAHTREASMIDAIGLSNLTNIQSGEYYGIVKNWSLKQKQQVGIVLLNKGLQIYLAEGERQIYPTDLT